MNDQFHYKLTTSEFSTIVRRFIGSNKKTICNRNVFNNGESGMHLLVFSLLHRIHQKVRL